MLATIRIDDEKIHYWFRTVLALKTKDSQVDTRAKHAERTRQLSLINGQQNRLLNGRLEDHIDEVTFNKKQVELRDRLASVKLQLDALDRSRDENAELTSRVFELSQPPTERWGMADYAEKRQILEIVWVNCRLGDVTLCPTMRKPFDVLVKGLVSEKSGG